MPNPTQLARLALLGAALAATFGCTAAGSIVTGSGGPTGPTGPAGPGSCAGVTLPKPGSVDVTVVDAAGKPAPGQRVSFLQASQAAQRDKTGWVAKPSPAPGASPTASPAAYALLCTPIRRNYDGDAATDADGEAVFSAVPPGDYRVWIGEDGGKAGWKEVDVKAGASSKVTLTYEAPAAPSPAPSVTGIIEAAPTASPSPN